MLIHISRSRFKNSRNFNSPLPFIPLFFVNCSALVFFSFSFLFLLLFFFSCRDICLPVRHRYLGPEQLAMNSSSRSRNLRVTLFALHNASPVYKNPRVDKNLKR